MLSKVTERPGISIIPCHNLSADLAPPTVCAPILIGYSGGASVSAKAMQAGTEHRVVLLLCYPGETGTLGAVVKEGVSGKRLVVRGK